MIRGFKMKLYENMAEEYERRHNALWPEMREMLKNHGAENYSIFLDEDTNILFAYLEVKDKELWDKSSKTEICRKWWDYMADIMETNPDNSPVTKDLKKVFTL